MEEQFNITTSLTNFETGSIDLLAPEPAECFIPTTVETISSQAVQQFLFCLYAVTSIVILSGNAVVIVVQLFGRESSQNMRKYLLNLAIADVITGVFSVPFTYTNIALGHWVYPHWLCPTAQYVQLLSVFVTSATLSIIGIERFIVILHPHSSICHWIQSHSRALLALSWLLGGAFAYLPIANTYTTPFTVHGRVYYQCTFDNEFTALKRDLFAVVHFVLTYALPLAVMLFSYVSIMHALRRNELMMLSSGVTVRTGSGSNDRERESGQSSTDPSTLQPTSSSASPNAKSHMPQQYLQMLEETSISDQCSQRSPNRNKSKIVFKNSHVNVNLNRSKIIKMMFMVLLLYCICWSPIKLYQFLLNYHFITHCTQRQFYLMIYSYIGCHWLAMANSFVNPIVYSFMSRTFRNDFRRIIKML